ncbi:hypothetical protein BdWA1_002706 [Babesia duncani]|uniref:Uncharacterized protein n=1 Tax=Babesia duncani TaxID=323732 RepID=A0AAD9UNP9_9APIC|nr:hypothetical protein BdWA1_002706 [Babesia duncani]
MSPSQICDETFCKKCSRTLLLFSGKDERNIWAECCIGCHAFFKRFKEIFSESSKVIDSDFSKAIAIFKKVLRYNKELSSKILQLEAYARMLVIHKEQQEPLPPGTDAILENLVALATEQRKQLSEIKQGLSVKCSTIVMRI